MHVPRAATLGSRKYIDVVRFLLVLVAPQSAALGVENYLTRARAETNK